MGSTLLHLPCRRPDGVPGAPARAGPGTSSGFRRAPPASPQNFSSDGGSFDPFRYHALARAACRLCLNHPGVDSTAADISRRQFLARSGAVTGLGLLASVLPGVLKANGWDNPAYAQSVDLVEDTFNGLVAFMLPGNDAYSVLQGETADGPGGIAAGGAKALIASLDRYLPTPQSSIHSPWPRSPPRGSPCRRSATCPAPRRPGCSSCSKVWLCRTTNFRNRSPARPATCRSLPGSCPASPPFSPATSRGCTTLRRGR
ncbi:MAG: twin-arginine translocation signal domain-containing protein [Actinobacteria bacterium]|nr:MAG: twin-arginine translocation signal domain-containing protein [Actinomycetota bacterium]